MRGGNFWGQDPEIRAAPTKSMIEGGAQGRCPFDQHLIRDGGATPLKDAAAVHWPDFCASFDDADNFPVTTKTADRSCAAQIYTVCRQKPTTALKNFFPRKVFRRSDPPLLVVDGCFVGFFRSFGHFRGSPRLFHAFPAIH